MKTQILLNEFEYSTPPFTMVVAELKGEQLIAEHLPLMKVSIDFENGILSLEGDWRFIMMAHNKHNETNRFGYRWKRVEIEAIIYPAVAINLDNKESDHLTCLLQGIINDGNFTASCSGLMTIDNASPCNGLTTKHWYINFYIYESQFNDGEINFKLRVHAMAMGPEWN